MRRRSSGGRHIDEAIARALRWEPTTTLREHRFGHETDDHVEITPAEAVAFVQHGVSVRNVSPAATWRTA